MGLDTYAAIGEKTDEDILEVVEQENGEERTVIKASVFSGISGLCGGMLSANGQGSFRGKVYDEVVEQVTGESLYQERITNPVVHEMAGKLRIYADSLVGGNDDLADTDTNYEITNGEIRTLALWFETTADNGLDVVGWW